MVHTIIYAIWCEQIEWRSILYFYELVTSHVVSCNGASKSFVKALLPCEFISERWWEKRLIISRNGCMRKLMQLI